MRLPTPEAADLLETRHTTSAVLSAPTTSGGKPDHGTTSRTADHGAGAGSSVETTSSASSPPPSLAQPANQ
jgi:hypothetical protein